MFKYTGLCVLVCSAFLLLSCASEETQSEQTVETQSTAPPVAEQPETLASPLTAKPGPPVSTPVPFDQAKIKDMYERVAALKSAYDQAYQANDQANFEKASEQNTELSKFIRSSDTLILLDQHPAQPCLRAVQTMSISQTFRWAARDSNNSNGQSSVSAQLAETDNFIQACAQAAGV